MFDDRFRYFFTRTPPDQLMAATGARRLAAAGAGNLPPIAHALEELVQRASPLGSLVATEDERLLCHLCYVLGLYEAVCRNAQPAAQSPLRDLPRDADLAQHLELDGSRQNRRHARLSATSAHNGSNPSR